MSSDQSAGIRIIKRKKGHAAHHGGAWKVAYADFVTAMMAFFLVMWIVGLSNPIKQAIAGYFKDPAAFAAAMSSNKSPFGISALSENKPGAGGQQNKEDGQKDDQERAKLTQAKKTIEAMISTTPEFKDLKKYIDIKIVDEGLEIDLLEAKESLFFDAASAKIKPSAQTLLSRIAAQLGNLPNKLILEGHTDNRPLARADGYTNWELSADRANSARRVMEHAGLRPDQVAQVRGYAATKPRDPEHPDHFSNRRVSIIVMMSKAMRNELAGAVSGGSAPPSPLGK